MSRRVVRRGAVRAQSRDEAREILFRRFPYGRIAGLCPARRNASSGAWEYEVELRRSKEDLRQIHDGCQPSTPNRSIGLCSTILLPSGPKAGPNEEQSLLNRFKHLPRYHQPVDSTSVQCYS